MSGHEPVWIASVIVDSALDRPLDYRIPAHLEKTVQKSMAVKVPVRKQLRFGIVWAIKHEVPTRPLVEIDSIVVDEPLLNSDLIELAQFLARYYCAPLWKVLRAMIPSFVREGGKEVVQLVVKPLLSKNALAEMCAELRQKSPAQAKVLDVLLASTNAIPLGDLLKKTGGSRSPVDTLAKKNVLSMAEAQKDRTYIFDQEFFQTKHKTLSEEQNAALVKISDTLSSGKFATHLLYGVTGSGKTEVFLQAIDHALSLGKGVIYLVPEIALTNQTFERLKSRFAEKIVILHHRLSDGERRDAWKHIRQGKCQLVIGARSAIFSPVVNLGLIIVDEEHEPSYKQSEDTPCYHARDVAVMRGKLTQATVVLGSATPSMESYANALAGKYILSVLTTRSDSATMPTITLIDMVQERTKGASIFSDRLLEGIKKRLALGEQTILFLNRRGYYSSQLCQQCGHITKCPHCDLAMTYHLGDNLLACHLCDYRLCPPPRICGGCKSSETMKFKGYGTEHIERTLHAILPEVRTLRVDADTTKIKGSHERLINQFKAGKADVLIGTQMIAKGLHFPAVTLVGVLYADTQLSIPDFRASENAFQLLTQVSGRSGRGALAGEVIMQTHKIEHPIIQLASTQNYPEFFRQEAESRTLFEFPPYAHLVKFVFTGKDQTATQKAAEAGRHNLIAHLPTHCALHPVVPCGHAKVKDLFRFQFLLRADKWLPLGETVAAMRSSLPKKPEVDLFVDVDPLSTFF